MGLIINVVNRIRRIPVVFLTGFILYWITLFLMVHWKREPPDTFIFFISAMWFIFIIYLIYELFFSLSRRKSVMKWVRGVLWPGLKNKSVVRKSYALSNISIILGAVAGLLSLSKVYWVICSLFFIL
ncbi:hypothetical protein [Yersinia pseudotuberculosis]|nr:hypothetical protein [Yersinia pseudotuberculosis]MBO1548966.1 hypothetical protein [Yersinia pseudotuberculosis]MBO1568941.1 hypothetical protein [Yersinia pseudotuberculosis]MBO1584089.1 hypothetical protein [Yersinia pseudotuberculosis]MBO1635636.1 hypothetical protein [Yersinia pseudotuberculosis]